MKGTLSKRELEVCQAFYDFDGDTKLILNTLCITHSTFRTHLHNIFNHLGAPSSVALMKIIIERNVVRRDG